MGRQTRCAGQPLVELLWIELVLDKTICHSLALQILTVTVVHVFV